MELFKYKIKSTQYKKVERKEYNIYYKLFLIIHSYKYII